MQRIVIDRWNVRLRLSLRGNTVIIPTFSVEPRGGDNVGPNA